MPYEPLHHKYRPQTFAELVGQEAVATTLTNALRQQRIAPAYLFTGARGTGKTSSARILAKSLNCLNSPIPTETPCGVCEACRMIANSSALDVIEIDAASNTGVDNIRELIERSQFAPVQCRYKVYVVDECHMLSTAAFNALLKTLEEPPDRVVFVLATTDPQRVLPTIISRCQRFDFRRIPLEAMVQHLRKIANAEGINITPEALLLVAQISQGGLRDAQSLLDQLSLLEGQITAERVWDLVGAVPERDLLALVQAIGQDDATTVLDRARRLMDRGREPLIVLQNLASFYRDLLIAKTSPDRHDLVAITAPTWADMVELVQDLSLSAILQGQQYLRESEVQVKNTTQPRLWLEVTLMGLLPSALASISLSPASPSKTGDRIPDVNPGADRTTRSARSTPPPTANKTRTVANTPPLPVEPPAADRRSTQFAPSQPVQPTPPVSEPLPPSVEPVVEAEPVEAIEATDAGTSESAVDLEQIWQEIIAQIRFRGTQVLLQQQGHLLAFDGQEARIGFKSQPLFQMGKKQLPSIEAAFEAVYQQKVRVSLEITSVPDAEPGTLSDGSTTTNGSATSAPPPRRITKNPSTPRSTQTTHESSPTYPPSASIPPASDSSVPSIEEPVSPIWDNNADEVKDAARSMAQFFNGEIVNLDDEISETMPIASTEQALTVGGGEDSEASSEIDTDIDGDPDADVPF
ncbi:DNA polymerase III subunit gamma/tau [Thermocoleostomius sinensis]|uniref:DNA polymerase III subunit gamma/tau n=1 Tax=Thermocoleostomius sinensis A174 TaxID=2016057 RepID=A0A9E8ZGB1_9CYAN|nr:DNA polymerase III subunit gamma/tau [Thermocoleostomius sinensis]WAL62904.1 DNA polymerase III subunit gamma/tau [Thermocoleostomius sinensis A174]